MSLASHGYVEIARAQLRRQDGKEHMARSYRCGAAPARIADTLAHKVPCNGRLGAQEVGDAAIMMVSHAKRLQIREGFLARLVPGRFGPRVFPRRASVESYAGRQSVCTYSLEST